MISNNINRNVLSFKNALILVFIILITYIIISVILRNGTYFRTVFGDLIFVIIDVLVILTLFYAIKVSASHERRMYIAWIFLTAALLSYSLGDIFYAVLELGLKIPPSPSVADVFYLLFYPLFFLGTYFLPRISLSRKEEKKLIIDIAIVTITVGLIFWIFLILPAVSSSQDFTGALISVIYIIGDLVLFFALLRIVFYRFKEVYMGPAILLGIAIIFQVVTDSIYYYQFAQGGYLSGGLLDIGWLLSILSTGLAAVLYVNETTRTTQRYKFRDWRPQFKLSLYLPIIWVIIAFFLLLWSNGSPNVVYIQLTVGLIVSLVLIRLFLTVNENKNLYLTSQKEVQKRITAENALKESMMKYKTIFEYTGTAIVIIEENTTLSLVNTEFENLSGYSKEEIENKKSWREFVAEDYQKKIGKYHKLRRINDDTLDIAPLSYEFLFRDKNQNLKNVFVTVTLFPETKKSLASLLDITDRKKAERELMRALEEKELLIKEIHHRVKNNLQIISSMLSLQIEYVKGYPKAINVLQESQNRVLSIAAIHETLYQSKDFTYVNFHNYLQNLISRLIHAYNASHISTSIDVDDISLNMETAIPCGLIISELVSNSLRYAFMPDKPGEIGVELLREDDYFKLTVQDDGVGLPDELDFKNVNSSLGLRLVNSLVEQLEGTIELDKSHGTKFTIRFKELAYKKRI